MTRINIKQRLVTIAVFLAAAALLGAVVVITGVAPIKASSGHWPPTRWFLAFAKSRSVATHSALIETPDLRNPHLALKGAGHYETSCAACHGSPAMPASPVAKSMTATPPDLAAILPKYKPRELFYIVKHGIIFTGMPAWPTQQRDDEVWAVVSFLRSSPGMSGPEYRDLVYPFAASTHPVIDGVRPSVIETCTRCHGRDGLGRGGAFPVLAGQNAEYLHGTLLAFAQGRRHSGVMQSAVARLLEGEPEALAHHFAGLPRPRPLEEKEPADAESSEPIEDAVERGREIATHGIPDENVPACLDCHGPGPISPSYPELAGQPVDYLQRQLRLFHSGNQGGTEKAALMDPVSSNLPEESWDDVALYYWSLGQQ